MKTEKTQNMAGSLSLYFYMEDSSPEEMDAIFDEIADSIAGILMDYEIVNDFDWQITQESRKVKNRALALMGIDEPEESLVETVKGTARSVKQYVFGNILRRLRTEGTKNDNTAEGQE